MRSNSLIILTLVFAYLLADMLVWRMPVDFGVTILIAAIVTAGWMFATKRDTGPVPVASALTVYGFGLLVTTSFSISLQHSVDQIIWFGLYVTVLVIAAELATAWAPEVFLAALRNASWLLVAVVAFITAFSALTGGNLRPPSPNELAAVFSLLLLPTLAEFVERPRRSLAIWIVAALTVIFITASRGGWFGLAAGLLTLAAHQRARLAVVWAWVRKFWPVAVPVGAFALFWQFTRTDHSTRWEFWVVATAIFLYRPITGAGPGTYKIFWTHLHPPPYFQAVHAHSLIFNTGAEMGLIGLIALGVLAVAVVRSSWRDAGLLAAVVAFGAHNLVDTMTATPAVMVVLAVLLGSRLGGLSDEHRLRTEMP